MDGQLPSIPSPTGSPTPPPPMGAAPAPHLGFTPALPGAGVRGRPSNDPDQQVAREVRANERRRIESLLPKAATDSKIRVFRLKEGQDRPAAHAKHALMVLMSELEEVKSEQGIDTSDYIREKLTEKYGDEGRFVCQAYDRDNRMLGIPSWEINLDPNAQDDDGGEPAGDDGDEEERQQQADEEERQQQAQQREEEIRQAAQRQAAAVQEQKPPAAPATDMAQLAAIISAMNSNKGPDTAAIMAQMQQQSTQMFVAMLQQQTAAQQAAAERDEKRRSERNQTFMTLLPLLLPMLKDAFFAPKKEGLDPATMILIETLKSQNAANPATSMISVMAEMAKAQSQLQSQAAAGAVEMQGQMTSMVMGQMMSTLKDAMNMKANLPAAEKEDSTMDMLAKVALPLIAGYAAQRQQAQAGPSPEELAQQHEATTPPALPAPAPAAPAPAPARPRPPAPAAPAAAPAPTDDERIYRCLETIMRLSNGAIPANQRWDALEWCSVNMPARMLAAIRTNREDDVLSMGSSAVASHADLLEWFSKDGSVDFLKAAITDIRLQALKQTTPDYVAKAVMLNQAFVDKHYPKPVKPAPAPKPAPVVEPPKPAPVPPAEAPAPTPPAPEAPPAAPPAEPKTVDAVVVPPEAPAAPEAEGAKRRKRS